MLPVATIVASLQSSISPYLHVATPTAHLLTPELPELRTSTSMRLHLELASRAPYLRASTSLHLQRISRTPELIVLDAATPTARLHTSIPPCHACGVPPDLHTALSPRRYTFNASLELHTSISLHLHCASRAVDIYPFHWQCLVT